MGGWEGEEEVEEREREIEREREKRRNIYRLEENAPWTELATSIMSFLNSFFLDRYKKRSFDVFSPNANKLAVYLTRLDLGDVPKRRADLDHCCVMNVSS